MSIVHRYRLEKLKSYISIIMAVTGIESNGDGGAPNASAANTTDDANDAGSKKRKADSGGAEELSDRNDPDDDSEVNQPKRSKPGKESNASRVNADRVEEKGKNSRGDVKEESAGGEATSAASQVTSNTKISVKEEVDDGGTEERDVDGRDGANESSTGNGDEASDDKTTVGEDADTEEKKSETEGEAASRKVNNGDKELTTVDKEKANSTTSASSKDKGAHAKGNPYDALKYMIVRNDGRPESLIKLVALKSLFAKQLPKMPRAYIARLVFDRRHISLAIMNDDPATKDTDEEVIGAICYRAFEGKLLTWLFCCLT